MLLKRFVLLLSFGAAVGGALSCGEPRCLIYCAHLQKLIFRDASGAPLTPLKVTDGQTVNTCALPDGGPASSFVTCTQDELTYDLRNFQPHSIRAEATTGQIFEGTITPESVATPQPSGSCGCGGSTLTPITLQLSPP